MANQYGVARFDLTLPGGDIGQGMSAWADNGWSAFSTSTVQFPVNGFPVPHLVVVFVRDRGF